MDDNSDVKTRTVTQVHDGVGWIDVDVDNGTDKISTAEALFEVMKSLGDIRSQNEEILRILNEDFEAEDDEDEKPTHWTGYVFSFNTLLIVCVVGSVLALIFTK